MKNYFKYIALAMLVLPVATSCNDDDDKGGAGQPVMNADAAAAALFGDSISLKVNCADEGGVPLSTLKAQLCYGDEVVSTQTLRTKTDGDYTVRLYAPLYKDVPDGEANIRLTLQNTSLKTSETTVGVKLSRPHYPYVNIVGADGTTLKLTPDADNPYLFKGSVTSSSRSISGYVEAPSAGVENQPQTFGLGTEGVTQGIKDNLMFAAPTPGTFDVWFNVLTYEFGPQSAVPVIELKDADEANVYVGELIQNGVYEISGSDKFATDSWYYDPDYFTRNADGTFTFNAITGTYTLKADFKRGGFKVWAMKDRKNTGTLNADGTGALWIIGSDCIGKPGYAEISGQGWWTDTDHDLCLAPIGEKVYQITLTVGKQLQADGKNISFKFYGQADWGTEFKGTAGTHSISTDSNVFAVGDGKTEYAGGKDDGNIYLRDNVELKDGDTYVLTVDLTQGTDKAKLKVEKK